MIALDFAGEWCCDRHPGGGFNLASYFPGQFYTEEDCINVVKKRKSTPKRQNRPTIQRPLLQRHLRAWRTEAHAIDPLRSVRPSSFILDDKSIVILSRIRCDKVTCVLDITRALEETEEWAEEFGTQIHHVIIAYDFDKPWCIGETDGQASDGEEDEDEDVEETEEKEPEANSEASEAEEFEVEEETIPRKRARIVVAPSREPVIVSNTSRPTRRTTRL